MICTQNLVYFNKWLHCFTSAEQLINSETAFGFLCIFLAFVLCTNPCHCHNDYEFYSQSTLHMKYKKEKSIIGLEQEFFSDTYFSYSSRAAS